MNRNITLLIGVGVLVLFFSGLASAEEYKNTRALSGLSVVKAYFDVNTGVPAKLKSKLLFIDRSYEQLLQSGVTPEFIVGFRSAASNFVTKGDEDYVFDDDEIAAKKKVHEWIRIFKKRGIIMEQCMLSAEIYEIDPQDFLPELEPVNNGYVSMIGYQTKGYSQINME